MRKLLLLILLGAAGFSTWNCQKNYAVAPLSPVSFTATPTATETPCGYPGPLCTQTFTPSSTPSGTPSSTPTLTTTFTVTSTPTITPTPPPTSTPSPLPTPQGIFGIENGSFYPSIVWVKDSNPNISSYKVYVSTDDATWVLLINAPKTAFTLPYCQVNDTTQAAPFTRYYYVVASNGGTPPDSPPSPQVWAVSGTTTNNTLTYSVTYSGGVINCARTGGGPVPGGVNRIWVVEDTSLNTYWQWGEGAVALTNVNYGYSATGLTYQTAQTLSPGTTYGFGTFTLNSNNWVIDTSAEGFVEP